MAMNMNFILLCMALIMLSVSCCNPTADRDPVFVGNPVGSERLQGLLQEVLVGIHNQ